MGTCFLAIAFARYGKPSRHRCFAHRALALACVALLACGIAACAPPRIALADEVGNLVVGADIDYAGYNTTWMSVDGNAAYCATPMLATPRSGPYSKSAVNAPSGRNTETVADLWFGFGSPGFDASLWPSTWYDGSAMTDARYAALTHILLSDTYSSSSASALYGCSAAFRSWAQRYVIGFDSQGALINGDATGRRIVERTGDVPGTFHAFQIATGASTQCVLSFSYEAHGSLELTKVSARPSVTDDNPLYSMEGACFGIFRDEACSNLACTFVCDESGYARADDLPAGTYWVRELQAPLHMAARNDAFRVEITDRKMSQVNGGHVENVPQTARLDMLVRKVDADGQTSIPQGDASLAGAVFTVRYHPQLEQSANANRARGEEKQRNAESETGGKENEYANGEAGDVAIVDTLGEPLRTWRFRTDENGEVHLSDAQDISRYFIDGDELPRDSMGFCVLPLGTYVIEETQAPQGYELNRDTAIITVAPDGSEEHDCVARFPSGEDAAAGAMVAESVMRGGIRVAKTDAELGGPAAVGGNSSIAWAPTLAGVQFEVANASSKSVHVGDAWFEPGQAIGIIESQWDESRQGFYAQSAPDALPFGTYEVREVAASNGYRLTDGSARTVEVRDKEEFAEIGIDGTELAFSNQVMRNDLELTKMREDDGKPLQVAFSLTSLATGEQHVLVCNEAGKASTASSFAKHTEKTNGNDDLLNAGRVATEQMDPLAGTWFGLGSDGGTAAPNDELAALPYGQYLVEELPCDANEGYELVSGLITIDHDASEQPTISATVVNHAIEVAEASSTSGPVEQKSPGKLAETGDRTGLPAMQLLGAAALAALALATARVKSGRRQAHGGRYRRRYRRR